MGTILIGKVINQAGISPIDLLFTLGFDRLACAMCAVNWVSGVCLASLPGSSQDSSVILTL